MPSIIKLMQHIKEEIKILMIFFFSLSQNLYLLFHNIYLNKSLKKKCVITHSFFLLLISIIVI